MTLPLTGSDVIGPFYNPGAPFRQDFAPGETGIDPANGLPTRLRMQGTIKNDQGTPIQGAMLDVWAASPPQGELNTGVYDMSPEYKYRGKVTTDAEGKYSLETLIPGHYPFNDEPNSPWRPEHIHVIATQPGDQFHTVPTSNDGLHIVVDAGSPLVTQIYFRNDGQTDVDDQGTDVFFQRNNGADRALTLTREVKNGFIQATAPLDFVLPTPVPSQRYTVGAQ